MNSLTKNLALLKDNLIERLQPLLDRSISLWKSVPTTTMAGVMGLAVMLLMWLFTNRLRRRRRRRIDSTHDKCVLVTGCDSGFGQKLVQKLLQETDFFIVAACHSSKESESWLAHSSRVKTVVADLATSTGRQTVVEATSQACLRVTHDGSLFALVNNAGVVTAGHTYWLAPKVYQKVMAVNYLAPVELTYELLPLLKRHNEQQQQQDLHGPCAPVKESSRIINMSSVSRLVPMAGLAPYAASKHALEAWNDVMRLELSVFDIQVLLVRAVPHRTELALSVPDSMTQTFAESDPQRTVNTFGARYIREHTAKLAQVLERETCPHLDHVVDDLFQDLVEVHPPARVLSGPLSKYGLALVAALPQSILFYLLRRTYVHPTQKLISASQQANNNKRGVQKRV